MKTDEFLNEIKNIINEDSIFSLVKPILDNQEENQGPSKIQQIEKELKSTLSQKGYTFLDEKNYFSVFKDEELVGGFFIDDDERWCFGEEHNESSQRNETLTSLSDYKRFYNDLKEFRTDMYNRFPGDKRAVLDEIDDILSIIRMMWDGEIIDESSQKNGEYLTKDEYLNKMYADLLSFRNNLEGSRARFRDTNLTKEQLKRAKEKVAQIEKLILEIRDYIKLY